MVLSREKLRRWQNCLLDGIVCRNPKLGLDTRAEFFTQLFEKHLLKGSRILDIGGRWGFYAEPLTRRGHHVTVLDVVKPDYQKAPVVIYDGSRIPFDDESFDVVLLITVLHHIRDLENVVMEARRVTRKTLIVVEDLYRHDLGRWWTAMRDRFYNLEFFGHPCRFMKQEEWTRFIERFGFTLIEERQVYTWLAGLRILNGVFVFGIGDHEKSFGG